MIKMSAGYTYWNPYVKCGVIMSLQLLKKEYEGELTNRFPGYMPYETLVQVNRFSPRFNAGGIGVFGIEWMNDRVVNVYTEVQLQVLNYTPKKSSIVESTLNDENNVNDLVSRDVEYVEALTDADISEPGQSKQLTFTLPMSGLSLSCGFRIRL